MASQAYLQRFFLQLPFALVLLIVATIAMLALDARETADGTQPELWAALAAS